MVAGSAQVSRTADGTGRLRPRIAAAAVTDPVGQRAAPPGLMLRTLGHACLALYREGQAPLLATDPWLVGSVDWSPAVDINRGAAGIFGPPDLGFPEDGVIAQGAIDEPSWVKAVIDLDAIATVRREGQVFNHRHWDEQLRVGRPHQLRL